MLSVFCVAFVAIEMGDVRLHIRIKIIKTNERKNMRKNTRNGTKQNQAEMEWKQHINIQQHAKCERALHTL